MTLPPQPPLPQDDHDVPVMGLYIPNVGIVALKGTTASAPDNYGYVTGLLAAALQVAGADVTQQNPIATNQVVGTPVYATTTLAGGATANVSLAAATGKTTYINGFYVSVAHTSAGTASGQVTLSLDGGTTTHMNFAIAVSTTYPGLVSIDFPDPIPAVAANTAIKVTSPTLTSAGIGSIAVFGYQL